MLLKLNKKLYIMKEPGIEATLIEKLFHFI